MQMILLQAAIAIKHQPTKNDNTSSMVTEEQAICAAKHLLQVCVLYNVDDTKIYLNSEPHVSLFLDMLMSAVMGATALMIKGAKHTLTLVSNTLSCPLLYMHICHIILHMPYTHITLHILLFW